MAHEELRDSPGAAAQEAEYAYARAGAVRPPTQSLAAVSAPFPHQRAEPSSLQIMQVQAAYEDARKSTAVMWLLWFFFGGLGGHRYYLRSYGYAIAMTFTLGGFGFWTLIDAFLMGRRLSRVNSEIRRDVYGRHGVAAF